jgi:hypothetical protein
MVKKKRKVVLFLGLRKSILRMGIWSWVCCPILQKYPWTVTSCEQVKVEWGGW